MPDQPDLLWDLPTRLFHWGLVAGIATCWITGSLLDNAMQIHLLAGYFTLSLLLFRLLWGIAGSQTSRFNHFVHGPAAVATYARTLLHRNSVGQQAGHNPIGGWSVILLLAASLTVAITGLFSNDEVDTHGPLAARVGDDMSERLTDWHQQSFDILAVFIGLHLLAILFYRLYKKTDLVKPMITGKLANCEDCNAKPASLLLAGILYAVCLATVVAIVWSGN